MSDAVPETPDLEPEQAPASAAPPARPSAFQWVSGMFLGGLAGSLVEATTARTHSTLGLAIAPAGVALGALGAYLFARVRARRGQIDRFYAAFAHDRGWVYVPEEPLHRDTPLLRAGDEQLTGRGFELPIDGLPCRLYELVEITGGTATPYVVLLAPLDLPGIVRLRIASRDKVGSPLEGMRPIELASEDFTRAYALEVDADANEERVHALFQPSLVAALLDLARASSYLGEFVELENGMLLLASAGTIGRGDGAVIDATVGAARPVLAQLRALGADAT